MKKRIRIALATLVIASATGFGISSSSSVAGVRPPNGAPLAGVIKPAPLAESSIKAGQLWRAS
jgi:hypothetical protein